MNRSSRRRRSRSRRSSGSTHVERRALRDDIERAREGLKGFDVRGARMAWPSSCPGRRTCWRSSGCRARWSPAWSSTTRPCVDRSPNGARRALGRSAGLAQYRPALPRRRRDGLGEVDQDPGRRHRQHDQGGWSQANYPRSVEQEKLNHLAHALDALFARFKQRPFDHLRGRRAGGVGPRGRGAAAPVPARAAGRAVQHRRRELLRRDVQAAAAEVVERTSRRRARGARPACSRASAAATPASPAPAGVMEALEQARVEILLLAEDFDAPELDDALEKAITQSAAGARGTSPRRSRDARRDRRCASILSVPRALVIVDFQNDFAPGGALRGAPTATRSPGASTSSRGRASTTSSSPRATGIRPTTARSPPRAGRGPTTACRGRPARELHPALDREAGGRRGREGTGPARPRATPASRRHGPRRAAARALRSTTSPLVGLATDYCVMNTALDALRNGFGVTVDSSRGAAGRATARRRLRVHSSRSEAAGGSIA